MIKIFWQTKIGPPVVSANTFCVFSSLHGSVATAIEDATTTFAPTRNRRKIIVNSNARMSRECKVRLLNPLDFRLRQV